MALELIGNGYMGPFRVPVSGINFYLTSHYLLQKVINAGFQAKFTVEHLTKK